MARIGGSMRDWFARTFPSLARLAWPEWIALVMTLGMFYAVASGIGLSIRQRHCGDHNQRVLPGCTVVVQEPLEMPDGTSAL